VPLACLSDEVMGMTMKCRGWAGWRDESAVDLMEKMSVDGMFMFFLWAMMPPQRVVVSCAGDRSILFS